ncbi:hypothetical protein BU17DRAFT_70843 [Hysterangium stoloniferum]|nr:hypothetical protein BU17DRAFT_70843 [Hysterangium stoloniferum]
MPRSQSDKEDMYPRFVEIANAINDYAESMEWTEVKGGWQDVHSRVPKSTCNTAPSIRPDSVFASKNSNMSNLQKKIDELKARQEAKEKEMVRNDETKISHVWWLQVCAVVEMKAKATGNDSMEALQQMFWEQLDRLWGGRERRLTFIRFSILKPHELGWDPSMKIYYPENRRHLLLPSYEFPFERVKMGLSPYRLKWVINSAGAHLGACEDFLTSCVDERVLHGKLSSYWTVRGVIRKCLGGNNEERQLSMPTSKPKAINSLVQNDIDQESNLHEQIVIQNGQFEYQSRDPYLVSRVFTRIIMETWGWPIKYFKDNLELLTVIRDVVQDHKDFYLSGVLHCDTWKFLSTSEIPPRKELDCVLANSYHFTFQVEGVFAEEDVVCTVLGVFNLKLTPAADYIKASLDGASRKVTKEEPCTLEDLHWQHFVEKLPMFQDRRPRPGFQTGTVPYMSHEVLARNYSRLYAQTGDGKKCVHDAANDMESFLWVIIYLVITWGSPGGFVVMNWMQLEVEKQNLFTVSGDDVSGEDENGERILENDILKSFHPYFKPLKRLVWDWYKLLVMAFRWRASEYCFIHDQVLDLLTKEIEALRSETMMDHMTDPIYDHKTTIELEHHQQCQDFISNAFLDIDSVSDNESLDDDKDGNEDISPDMRTAKSKSRSDTYAKKENWQCGCKSQGLMRRVWITEGCLGADVF